MPHIVVMKKQIIQMNKYTKIVANCFLEALKENDIEESPVLLEQTKSKGGLWSLVPHLFPQGLQKVIEALRSANEYEFEKLQVEVNDQTKSFRDEYINFLNHILKMDGVTSGDIVTERIQNHYVLIREILIRIFTDALSANMSKDDGGEKLLNTMECFVKNIKSHPELLQSGVFRKLPRTIIMLATSHDIWINWMRKLASSIKAMEHNKAVVTNILGYLDKIEQVINRQLLAELTTEREVKTVHDKRFHSDMLGSSIMLIEDQCIDRLPEASSLQNSSLEDKLSPELMSRYPSQLEKRMLWVTKSIHEKTTSILVKNKKKSQHVQNLYAIKIKTKFLLKITAQLDTLNNLTGWIAITSGAVKLDAFSKLLKEHAALCSTSLQLLSDTPLLAGGGEIARALIMYEATTVTVLTGCGFEVAGQLSELQNPVAMEILLNSIGDALHNLLNLQRQLPPGYELVDKEVCKHLSRASMTTVTDSVPQTSAVTTRPELPKQEEFKGKITKPHYNSGCGFIFTFAPRTQKMTDEDNLRIAASDGDLDQVRNLVERGVNVNGRGETSSLQSLCKNLRDKTALILATQYNMPHVVYFLLENKERYGLDLNAQEQQHQLTALDYALYYVNKYNGKYGYKELAEALRSHGALEAAELPKSDVSLAAKFNAKRASVIDLGINAARAIDHATPSAEPLLQKSEVRATAG